MVQTQFGASIKILGSDNGGEYIYSQLKKYLTDCGIIHQTSCVHTPQQNGVAESKNCHLLKVLDLSYLVLTSLKLFSLKLSLLLPT